MSLLTSNHHTESEGVPSGSSALGDALSECFADRSTSYRVIALSFSDPGCVTMARLQFAPPCISVFIRLLENVYLCDLYSYGSHTTSPVGHLFVSAL